MIVSHSLPNLDIGARELATGAEYATIKGNVKQVDELCLWRDHSTLMLLPVACSV